MKKIIALAAATVIIASSGFAQTSKPTSDTTHKTMKKTMKKPLKKRMDSTSMMSDSSSAKPMK